MLGAINLTRLNNCGTVASDALRGIRVRPHTGEPIDGDRPLARLDWVIAGGESGPGARPMHPDWVRSLRDQCRAAGVPFFFKQWGEYEPCELLPDRHGTPWRVHFARVGKRHAGRLLDGREWNEFPAAAASSARESA
jgi:protein gp37